MAKQQATGNSLVHSLQSGLWAEVVEKRLASPLGLMLMVLLTIPLAFIYAQLDLKMGIVLTAAIIGAPMVLYALFNPTFNLGLMLFLAVSVTLLFRVTSAPLGLLLDVMIVVGLVGVFLKLFRDPDFSFLKNPLSYMIMIWLFYNFLQVLNPTAPSRLAWVYSVRTIALQLLVFFVGAYALKGNKKGMYWLLGFILLVMFANMVWGVKQYFFGLTAGEMAWITADPHRYELFFQWNMMRLPSLCNDPTTFGIMMSCFAVVCIILAIGINNTFVRAILGLSIIGALMGMSFSGTRTAAVIIPAGIVFYMGLTMNRKVLIVGGILMLFGAGLMMKSTSIGVIYRIQSAFKPGTDDSMNVRLENQKLIQPFIRSHPMGSGLGSTGVWAKRFSPGFWLANFAHDSSFVRMGVEMGWIGLLLYALMHFIVVRTGIYYYYRCRDPQIKMLYATITAVCFMLLVASYAQEAIPQQPLNVIYNILIAMLICLRTVDPAYAPLFSKSSSTT